jgi:hypothetical protein
MLAVIVYIQINNSLAFKVMIPSMNGSSILKGNLDSKDVEKIEYNTLTQNFGAVIKSVTRIGLG